jgi:CRP/FNR family transcriptional regulator, anaerobic regulatory protein
LENSSCNCERCRHKLCVRRVPIFSTLDAEELGRIVSLIVRKQYSKGELIFLEGTRLESLIIINSGLIKAFKDTNVGKEQILYIFSPGDFFGEKNLLTQQEATYNAEALEETHVCMINKGDFQQLLRELPDISSKILGELCNRIAKLENTIQDMGTKNVDARVSAALLEFSKKYGKDHPKGILIELPLSREGIANYIGGARETVSRKMSHLQENGIIEMLGNKKVIILDKEALKQEIE